MLWNSCRGIDNTALSPVQPRRSIGAEVNWGLRFTDIQNAVVSISKLSDEVAKRLMDAGVKGRCVVMKIKKRQADATIDPHKFLGHGRVDNLSNSVAFVNDVSSADEISAAAVSLFYQLLEQHKIVVVDLRGMGIHVQLPRVSTIQVSSTTRNLLQLRRRDKSAWI